MLGFHNGILGVLISKYIVLDCCSSGCHFWASIQHISYITLAIMRIAQGSFASHLTQIEIATINMQIQSLVDRDSLLDYVI